MTELEVRKNVVSIAEFFLKHYKEVGNHKFIIDLYNQIAPLPRGYKVTYSDAWCAVFVSAVGYKCRMEHIILSECSCSKMIALYKAKNLWVEDDGYTPNIADLVFYDWEDNGKGDNIGAPNHVGIVTSVSNGIITVIEGNKGNAVAIRNIHINGLYIRGYATPDYASIAIPNEPKLNEWAKDAYKWAVDLGITDGSFPTEPITLERFLTILYRYDEKRRNSNGTD